MSYTPRDHETLPWVAENGLRVCKRTSQSVFLRWSLTMEPESTEPSPSTSVEETRADRGKDGVQGPWYEVQMRKACVGEKWDTIYRGYRTKCEVKELAPDAILHFRMKKNGDEKWGSPVIAATDACAPLASDIHRAVNCNAEDMVLRIIGGSKDAFLRKLLQTHDSCGQTPLMTACREGNCSIATLLIKSGAAVNAASVSSGRTPLMHACASGNVRLLEILDKHDANWNLKDKLGCNAFHHAIDSSKLVSMKYAVARCGIDLVHSKDGMGWTPLLRAVTLGAEVDIVNFLLSKGADACGYDTNHNKSCLIAAALFGRKEICDILLKHGADPTYKNKNGQTAYDIASSRCHQSIADSIVWKLTEMASDRNSTDVHENSASSRPPVAATDRQAAPFRRESTTSSAAATAATTSRVIFGVPPGRPISKDNE